MCFFFSLCANKPQTAQWNSMFARARVCPEDKYEIETNKYWYIYYKFYWTNVRTTNWTKPNGWMKWNRQGWNRNKSQIRQRIQIIMNKQHTNNNNNNSLTENIFYVRNESMYLYISVAGAGADAKFNSYFARIEQTMASWILHILQAPWQRKNHKIFARNIS